MTERSEKSKEQVVKRTDEIKDKGSAKETTTEIKTTTGSKTRVTRRRGKGPIEDNSPEDTI